MAKNALLWQPHSLYFLYEENAHHILILNKFTCCKIVKFCIRTKFINDPLVAYVTYQLKKKKKKKLDGVGICSWYDMICFSSYIVGTENGLSSFQLFLCGLAARTYAKHVWSMSSTWWLQK